MRGGVVLKKNIKVELNKKLCKKLTSLKRNPIDEIISACTNIFAGGMDVINKSDYGCEISATAEAYDNDYVRKIILGIIKSLFELDDVEFEATVEVNRVSQTHKQCAETAQNAEDMTAIEEINRLVGVSEFKKLANEIVAIAPQVNKYSTHSVFAHQSYLFSINDGCGLTTYLNHFANLLDELGLFEFCDSPKVIEEKLQMGTMSGTPDFFSGALSSLKNKSFNKKKGQLICIDISEWMNDISGRRFKSFLSILEDNSDDYVFVFRIPFVENDVLHEIRAQLNDLLFIREVSFTPLNNEELIECAERFIIKLGYAMCDDAWDVFNAKIAEEKSDGKFYGNNTVNKVAREIIYRKQYSNTINHIDDTVIKKDDIISLAVTLNEIEKSAGEMLDDLVGMESMRKRIDEIVTQISVAFKNKSVEMPCLHMKFIGNPGTGKTTVARIIGKMLKDNGVLRNGSFFEYNGRDFCGRYIGETAPKTASMCRDAYGSVLFIDEAYSLFRDENDTKDFGLEALETLMAEMENHRKDLVVIMAGYEDEMDTLMKGNPGLRSRITYTIEFPNYTREQLYEIFVRMVDKSFKCDHDFLIAAKSYFNEISDDVISSKSFSNARFVRNLFERTWGKAAMRSKFNLSETIILQKEDFIQACSEREFVNMQTKRPKMIGAL